MLASSAGCARRTSPNNSPPSAFDASFPSQFSIDELRRQMDKKHNIRNMSVIAHVDHVRRPPDARAFPRAAGLRRDAIPERPPGGFGRGGGKGQPTRDRPDARARDRFPNGDPSRARERASRRPSSPSVLPARRGHRDAACPPAPARRFPPLPFLRPVAAARRLAMTRHMPPVREPSRMGLRRLAFFSSFVRSLVRPSHPLTLLDPPSPPPVSFDRRANPR